jgi:sigma-B regulation protein RsbU (phosphoserine phosphatase)
MLMIEAPIPVDEDERLASLRALDLLDSPAEERFDRITRLLTRLFRVPIAYLALIDSDRQWFKSSCGLNSTQTDRGISFCGHAILGDDVLVIPDTVEDERFRDNPLVLGEPYVRFYAGYPLSGPDGKKVGTLCIADRRPRHLSDDELETLRELARVVERELNLTETVHLQRDLLAARAEAFRVSQMLQQELQQASEYVRSLLPEPLDAGPVRTRWWFEPSSQLGGDGFGYAWLDPDHFAVYLLDASGHGVGAALLSLAVMNALLARTLPDVDFHDPAAVLAGLNEAFPMDRHDGRFVTLWYGVFDRRNRELAYASAGHPPGVLREGPGRVRELSTANLAIGILPDKPCDLARIRVPNQAHLYLFSDGAFEIEKCDGTLMLRGELVEFLAASPEAPSPRQVHRFCQRLGGSVGFRDDFSFLELFFD